MDSSAPCVLEGVVYGSYHKPRFPRDNQSTDGSVGGGKGVLSKVGQKDGKGRRIDIWEQFIGK